MKFDISSEEAEYLVRIARAAIESALEMDIKPYIDNISEKLFTLCGVFVTLNEVKSGFHQLRGCIGFPYPVKPLAEAVVDAAISAALRDPRFPTVSKNDMNSIVIEISILTPPEVISVDTPLQYPSQIKIGVDGLIIARGRKQGLLLPQVAVDWRWNAEEFLTQCCLKASLEPDAWLLPGTEISKFQAIIFAEDKPRGSVLRVEV